MPSALGYYDGLFAVLSDVLWMKQIGKIICRLISNGKNSEVAAIASSKVIECALQFIWNNLTR